jgi:protein-S-isoprenylcysteine O-methyltransferase Ste14
VSPKTSSVGIGTILGWLGIAIFVVIYAVELVPQHKTPVTIQWTRDHFGKGGLIALNIVIVLAFLALLPYRRPSKGVWKSRGTFVAFVIALMTEMFGWPLLLFLASPLVDVPRIAPRYYHALGHWLPAMIGTAVSFLGLALIAVGWHQIHRAEGLVTNGLYRFMRHPQYTGIFLFTLGWIIHWPSIVTIGLWPVLLAAYVWLARMEEKQALEEFGDAWVAYARQTKRFIPYVV